MCLMNTIKLKIPIKSFNKNEEDLGKRGRILSKAISMINKQITDRKINSIIEYNNGYIG